MIRIEVICAHAEQPRARDTKAPCDSTRNRSLQVDVVGDFHDAKKALERQAVTFGWIRWAIPAIGLRKAFICGNCGKRARGEI